MRTSKAKQRRLLRHRFEREIFPVLTPLAFDTGHPFPHISNLCINLAVVIHDPLQGERSARLKVPDAFPRLLRIPNQETAETYEHLGLAVIGTHNYVQLEQVVAASLDLLFPGLEIQSAFPFRVTRDADFEIQEDDASDLLASVEESVGMHHFGSAIRLEVDQRMPAHIRDILTSNLGLAPYQVYTLDGPLEWPT